MTDYERSLPAEYQPLSPWAYFGLGILYSIPLLGLVMLIIHAVSGGNINRRNYARSYFCVYVLAIVLVIVLSITGIDWAGLAQGVGTPA